MTTTTATGHDATRTAQLIDALANGAQIHDLGRRYELGMPQSPNHPEFRMTMPRRHGDAYRSDRTSAANDLLTMGTHVGTHIDALGHLSWKDEVYGGANAMEIQKGGKLASHGIDEVGPIVARGVMLDIPALLDVERLEGGFEITPEHLDAAVARQDTEIRDGDVVIIRSGWGQNWAERDTYQGKGCGVPGVSEAGAYWLSERNVRAAGADTIAFEMLAPGAGHALLPAHRVLLVETGINIIETLALEDFAPHGITEFLFMASPLNLIGATGSPVRPLAITA